MRLTVAGESRPRLPPQFRFLPQKHRLQSRQTVFDWKEKSRRRRKSACESTRLEEERVKDSRSVTVRTRSRLLGRRRSGYKLLVFFVLIGDGGGSSLSWSSGGSGRDGDRTTSSSDETKADIVSQVRQAGKKGRMSRTYEDFFGLGV